MAYAAICGAVLQVASTALLQRWMGLEAIGLGAVLGQGLALLMLVYAVRTSVQRGLEAILVMLAGGVAAAFIQALNGGPDSTIWLRLAVTLACLTVAVVVGARSVRALTTATPNPRV